jgi:predicted Zn finger-like uncharacterized protein
MILTCPECATSYFVDDSKIPSRGRTVKCANCSARWVAKLVPELELSASQDEGAVAREPPPPVEEAPLTIAELPGDALPKAFRAKADTERKVRQAAAMGIVWAGAAAALAVLIALAVVFRVDVVRLWPRSAAAYASVGLPVNSLGLVIEGVRAEPALQDGRAALSISGMIRNIEDRPLLAPPLKITLLNKSGKAVATKIARAADPRIPPGETRHFAIALLDPPSSAHDLEVAFGPASQAAKGEHQVESKAHAADKHEPALRGTAEPAAPHGPAPVEARPLAAGSPDALDKHE